MSWALLRDTRLGGHFQTQLSRSAPCGSGHTFMAWGLRSPPHSLNQVVGFPSPHGSHGAGWMSSLPPHPVAASPGLRAERARDFLPAAERAWGKRGGWGTIAALCLSGTWKCRYMSRGHLLRGGEGGTCCPSLSPVPAGTRDCLRGGSFPLGEPCPQLHPSFPGPPSGCLEEALLGLSFCFPFSCPGLPQDGSPVSLGRSISAFPTCEVLSVF